MHRTSQLKMQSVWQKYILPAAQQKPVRILDVGSKSYSGHDTYASLFQHANVHYTGLDLEPGRGVDLVPAHPFLWRELSADQFDFCVSGQTFEHNPMFWITFAEIARVLRPSGLTFIIAPGRGVVHRYPLDCWRFFPDSWHALCQYTGMELLETYFEDGGDRHIEPSLMWCDSCVIAKKPEFHSPDARKAFDAQLVRIASTAVPQLSIPEESEVRGPAMSHYLSQQHYRSNVVARIQTKVRKIARRLQRKAA